MYCTCAGVSTIMGSCLWSDIARSSVCGAIRAPDRADIDQGATTSLGSRTRGLHGWNRFMASYRTGCGKAALVPAVLLAGCRPQAGARPGEAVPLAQSSGAAHA